MRSAHEIAAALLGVWALDACSLEEAEMVMEHLPQCTTCAAEAARLRGTADLLGAAAQPPAWLRARTLERAKARRPAASPCPEYAEPYAAQVAVLDSLLGELTGPEWSAHVIYDWSVQDVVAHLGATDSLVAALFGVAIDSDIDADADAAFDAGVIQRRTAAVIDRERGREQELTRTAWRAQADALCRALPPQAAAARRISGIGMRISDVVVARAFETWVHSDDIATTLHRGLPPPLPRHLRPIAALGVRSLPRALAMTHADRPGATAQVMLDGPGGGEWIVRLDGRAAPDQIEDGGGRQSGDGGGRQSGDGGGRQSRAGCHDQGGRPARTTREPAATPGSESERESEPVVRLRMDVLEFCFLAGGRRDPATVSAEVTGDVDLGRDLLAAAPAFSGP